MLFVCRFFFIRDKQISEHPVNAPKIVWVNFSAGIEVRGPKRAEDEPLTHAELDRQHVHLSNWSPDEGFDIV